jgi:hypothetical protein
VAAARLASPGYIGDLYMGNVRDVPIDYRVKRFTVGGQVVEIAQEADIGMTAGVGPLEHGGDVSGGAQRVGLRPADRFDQYSGADPGRRLRCTPNVLDGQLVLILWPNAVDAVAIERVEPAHAEPRTNVHGDVDVVVEFDGPGRDGEHSAVRASQIAGEEVQADERDAGVGDRPGERVDVPARGHGAVKRPPELHCIEPGCLRRGGPLQER